MNVTRFVGTSFKLYEGRSLSINIKRCSLSASNHGSRSNGNRLSPCSLEGANIVAGTAGFKYYEEKSIGEFLPVSAHLNFQER